MKGMKDIDLPFKLFKRGKVRDVYEVDDKLLIVSSDRISAFDFVLPSIIPEKGKVLNQISSFWFGLTADKFNNHIVDYHPGKLDQLSIFRDKLEGRAVLTRKLKTFPVEAIVRNYLVGSGWKSYERTGEISGVKPAKGLIFGSKLKNPIFTPTTKAEVGHDMNVDFEKMKNMIGSENSERIRDLSISLFNEVSSIALSRGIIIADTKFEFGLDEDDEIIVCDEIFTPDSSRFWKLEDYKTGIEPPSFDKQFVRNFLLNSTWDRKSTPPPLPEDVIDKTREKYFEIYQILTGEKLK